MYNKLFSKNADKKKKIKKLRNQMIFLRKCTRYNIDFKCLERQNNII